MITSPAQRLSAVEEYYFSRKLAEVRALELRGHHIVNLGIGNPDMMPSADTLEALAVALQKSDHHGYQPYRGIPDLRKAISEFLRTSYGVTINPDTELLPLIGSKEGILYTSLAFLNPGDEVLIPDPGYPTYTSVTRLVEAVPRFYALSESTSWQPDLDELESADLGRVKLMWVNYPHMPTGVPADPETFRRLVAFARRHRILLCHDNPYSHIVHQGRPTSILAVPGAAEVAVELNSLSKSHNMAGWRIGWVAGAQDHIDVILKVLSNVESGIFRPLQHAAATALRLPESWHTDLRAQYRRRREHGERLAALLGCDVHPGQVGMFVWARIPDHAQGAEAFSDMLLDKGRIFITPGTVFGSRGDRFIRISLCSPEGVFEEAIRRARQLDAAGKWTEAV
jgi:hypothetical protein